MVFLIKRSPPEGRILLFIGTGTGRYTPGKKYNDDKEEDLPYFVLHSRKATNRKVMKSDSQSKISYNGDSEITCWDCQY